MNNTDVRASTFTRFCDIKDLESRTVDKVIDGDPIVIHFENGDIMTIDISEGGEMFTELTTKMPHHIQCPSCLSESYSASIRENGTYYTCTRCFVYIGGRNVN